MMYIVQLHHNLWIEGLQAVQPVHLQASFSYSRPGRDRPGFGRQTMLGKKLGPPEYSCSVTPGGAETPAQTLSILSVLGGKKQSPCLPWKQSQQRDRWQGDHPDPRRGSSLWGLNHKKPNKAAEGPRSVGAPHDGMLPIVFFLRQLLPRAKPLFRVFDSIKVNQ
jgi:hypothetical protein